MSSDYGILPHKNYVEAKLDEITKFINENAQYLDNNKDYADKVRKRIADILLVASFIANPSTPIQQLVGVIKSANMDGLIKMFSETLQKDFFIDLNKTILENSKPIIGTRMLATIKDFKEMCDAEIVEIG